MNRERFYGYIYNENGQHGGAKLLNGTIELNAFVEQHADSAPRIIVTDALDRCVLESRNGEVVVAPAHALTLEEVGYPDASEYGAQASAARRFRG